MLTFDVIVLRTPLVIMGDASEPPRQADPVVAVGIINTVLLDNP